VSVLLLVAGTAAFVSRSSRSVVLQQVEDDLVGLQLIELRVEALGLASIARRELLAKGAAGEDVAVDDLGAAVAPMASREGPIGVEVELLAAHIEEKLAEGLLSDGVNGRMLYVDELLYTMCCAGKNGGNRAVSDRVRTIGYLSVGQAGVTYFVDDVLGAIRYVNATPIEPDGFSDYMGGDVGYRNGVPSGSEFWIEVPASAVAVDGGEPAGTAR